MHAFITYRLDYCISPLLGCHKSLLKNFNMNRTLLLFYCHSLKTELVTPILKELHWLFVVVRIGFKILVLIFKANHAIVPL